MAYAFKDCKVEISTNGSAWTAITAYSASVAVDGGRRRVGVQHNFTDDYPAQTAGKRDPLKLEVHHTYSEGGSDPFEVIRAAYEAGSALYVRWSPRGGTAGQFLFTSDAGIVLTPPYPTGEAHTGAVLLTSFVLQTPKVTKSTV